MGFLDKMKAVKNAVTGGGARVFVESEPLAFGEPFKVTVRAEIKDANIDVDRVYLLIKGYEEVRVEDYDFEFEEDGRAYNRRELIERRTTTLDMEIDVAEAQTLDANEKYEWEGEVELPEDARPPYYGDHCRHYYMVQAGLDAFGNDPDSGWQDLE